jgi:hydroxymethylbilane synthase
MTFIEPNAQKPAAGLVRIGTRGSQLARWQAEWVARTLKSLHPDLDVELVEIKTQGDRDRNSSLSAIGGAGLFTKEIQVALLDRRVDLAVHSLKDLPTEPVPGLVLAAVPPRESTSDALIAPQARTLDALPPGARVGTSALRRRAQLLNLRPDLQVENLRGNVETRLNTALQGRLDAVILAQAGLNRLGLQSHITESLGPPRFLSAVGQGALGLECRIGDEALKWVSPLDDPTTHACVAAERALLEALGGGCVVPMAALGRVESGRLRLDVSVLDADGRHRLDGSETGDVDAPEALGRRLAGILRSQGAETLLRTSRPQ